MTEAIQGLEASREEAKTRMELLGAELQGLCSDAANTGDEGRLARKEVHTVRGDLSEARAATESQEMRMRVFATEAQALRTHVAESLRRSEEDVEACRARAASDASDLRRLLG